MEYGDWPGAGKGLPLQGNVFAVTWEGSGKAAKAHRGVSWWAVLARTWSKWSMATGQALAKDCCCNVFAMTRSGKAVKAHRGVLCRERFDPLNGVWRLARRWQRTAAAGKGLLLQGNVFAVTWEGSGKAVKAHRGVLCPDGACFAHVLKPKGVKAHRRVLCRDGPCFAHVLKPSKWSMATGQALAKNCRCRATCLRWPGKAVAKR